MKEYQITRPSYEIAVLDNRYAIMRDGVFIDLTTNKSIKKDGVVRIDEYMITYRSLLGKVFHVDNPKTLVLPVARGMNKLLEVEKEDVFSKLYLPYELYREYHDVHMSTYSRLRIKHGFSCSKKISDDLPEEVDIYGMKGLRYKDTCLYMTECGMVFTKHTEGFKYRKYNNPKSEVRYVKDGKLKVVIYRKVKEATWGEI